jgi:hypothetical protein
VRKVDPAARSSTDTSTSTPSRPWLPVPSVAGGHRRGFTAWTRRARRGSSHLQQKATLSADLAQRDPRDNALSPWRWPPTCWAAVAATLHRVHDPSRGAAPVVSWATGRDHSTISDS